MDQFFLLFSEGNFLDCSAGANAVEAIRSYYESLDSYCPVPEDTEQWDVVIYQIPENHKDTVLDMLERTDGDGMPNEEIAPAILTFLGTIDGVIQRTILVQYQYGDLLAEISE